MKLPARGQLLAAFSSELKSLLLENYEQSRLLLFFHNNGHYFHFYVFLLQRK